MPIPVALTAVTNSEVSRSELGASDDFAFSLMSTSLGGLNGQSSVQKNAGPLNQGLSRSELTERPRVPASAGLSFNLT